jgi:hypothetical protein
MTLGITAPQNLDVNPSRPSDVWVAALGGDAHFAEGFAQL